MAYSAMSIAKFIISHCYKEKCPVSNLKLQKIMYYAWVDYYNETQQPLYYYQCHLLDDVFGG